MNDILVYKAQSIGDRVAQNLRIEATNEFPNTYEDENIMRFDSDAKRIVDALWASLPGGTLDRVLDYMLRKRLSSLVVLHPAPEADTIPPESPVSESPVHDCRKSGCPSTD